MRTDGAGQFPDALNRIQFRTIRRQKIQGQNLPMLPEPRFKSLGMMPARIVDYHNHPMSLPAMAQELIKKLFKRFGIELLPFQSVHQPTIMTGDCTEDGNTFAGWRVEHNWIMIFRRHPHPTAGTVLLEMALVFEPKIKILIVSDAMQFFYMLFALPDRRGQSPDAVCAGEIPVG